MKKIMIDIEANYDAVFGFKTSVGRAAGVANQQMFQYQQMFKDLAPDIPPEEYRWDQAFARVLGTGTTFYLRASASRKRFLEQKYTELATHDTRRGRKAAAVVAYRVQLALDEANAPTTGRSDRSLLPV